MAGGESRETFTQLSKRENVKMWKLGTHPTISGEVSGVRANAHALYLGHDLLTISLSKVKPCELLQTLCRILWAPPSVMR